MLLMTLLFPQVVRFIDRSVFTDSTIEAIQNYVSYQEHNHSRSCQREIRGKRFCRFGIPYPLMPSTEIRLPLPEDTNADDLGKYQQNFANIHALLNSKLSNEEEDQVGSFEQFLTRFAAYYSFSKKKRSLRTNQQEEQEDDYTENNDFDVDDNDTAYTLRNNMGFVYERRNPIIIRFPSFNVNTSREDYFRVIVMLYLPWRDEQEELIENDNEQTCSRFKDIIEANRLEFEIFKEGELEEILQEVREENEIENNEHYNITTTQALDDEFRALAVSDITPNTNVLNIHDGRTDETNDNIRLIRLPVLMTESELLSSIRELNVKQRIYLQHLLQNVVENNKFCEFVAGGAGVGKSRLIKTIYHSITQRFNSVPGSNRQKVLLSAPTGKAAFNIEDLLCMRYFRCH
ncbi:hypothetical protein EVAR_71837_1 [Eumeta japonica]|uniref:ATP-dependent DNA helicase n=1 Tax=Eumeta variegata TaxID=151549 RepID=A0A4C1SMG6_EUMVA|nr:hypothetical protein EVAR_71837_1 [Eumeta japonica]